MNETALKDEIKIAPNADGEFLIGNLRDFQRDILGTLTENFGKHGDIVRFKIASRTIYAVRHPDFAHEILVSRSREFLKAEKTKGLGIILGAGLVTNGDYESWLTQRRMMQPVFHRQRIAALANEMTAAGDNLLARWKEFAANGRSVNMVGEMMRVTLEIITRTMFGTDVSGEAVKVGEAINFLSHFVSNRLRNPFAAPLILPTPANRTFQRSRKMLDEIIYSIIRERRSSGEKRDDLLEMLLAARDEETGEGMDEKQIRDEVLTIFAAGHETTANALSWTWYLLAQHPKVLKKMQSEIDTVLEGKTPTLDDVPKLKYVAMVFNESLRLYPPAPIIPRRVVQEKILRGYRLPKDSLVFTSIYHIQRHPNLWNAPESFDPERWLPEQTKPEHKLAFMPFGAGQRLCIGNHMATMEGVLLLAQIAAHYEPQLVSTNSVSPDVGVTMTPKDGLEMILKCRRRARSKSEKDLRFKI